MPSFAHVAARLLCPKCRSAVTELLWMQWGYLPGSKVRDDLVYEAGDPIRWRACADDSIIPWALFADSSANGGDPAYSDLITRDYWLTDYEHSCGAVLGGGAVEVRGGVITKAWLYETGEFDNSADFYLITQGLSGEQILVPKPEWSNHRLTRVDASNCGAEIRLAYPRASTSA